MPQNVTTGGALGSHLSRASYITHHMIRIAITPAAFDAIAATLPLGSVGFEPATGATDDRLVRLEAAVVDKLKALRGPGESYSGVILRLVELETNRR